jgi:sporulation protein YlmC with PRC-barrel domain
MRLFTAATIVSLTLAASPLALAQGSSSPGASGSPPAASTERPAATPGTTTQEKMSPSSPSTATAPRSGTLSWYSHQAGEMRASKLIGTAVKNQAGETIGDINEIVLNKDGNVAAAIIGVGGFLGIGEREVAVDFKSLQLNRDTSDNLQVVLNANKEGLKSAPAWTWSTGTNAGGTSTGTGPAKPTQR